MGVMRGCQPGDLRAHARAARHLRHCLVYQEPGQFPTVYLKLTSSHRAASPGDCIRLRVEGTDAGSMVRGSAIVLEHEGDKGWARVHLIISGSSPTAAPQWESYGPSGMFAVTMVGYRGTKPLCVRLPPVQSGDYRLRLDLLHGDQELGDVRAWTATLYAPLRVVPQKGREA
jgi:hypothetical protein